MNTHPTPSRWIGLAAGISTLWVAALPRAQDGAVAEPSAHVRAQWEAHAPRVDPAGIPGHLLICGGGALPDEVWAQFVELAGGDDGHIVVIPTASARADQDDAVALYAAPWAARTKARITVLHTRDRDTADEAAFCAPLRDATGVWISGGDQNRLAAAYADTRLLRELLAVRDRGGVIGGSSAGAAIQSAVMIGGGREVPELAEGFDLLPGAIVDQHFVKRDRRGRLQRALAAHPGRFGVGIAEGTALRVSGRQMAVLGQGTVEVLLAAGAGRPPHSEVWARGQREDLIRWQRAAWDRQLEPFPQVAEDAVLEVPSGTVLLVGGGGVPAAVVTRFIEAAGGRDAPIVVIPTAAGPNAAARPGFEVTLRRAGCTDVTVFHHAHPSDVATADLAPLRRARGLWFGGGRQWRLVDAYHATEALPLFHAVLERGGVIAGSSAGTSIQAEYMVRGNPMGNRDMMALGYERGFGFLRGAAADQHFTQRNRLADLRAVAARFPTLLCLGIDESTAVVVHGRRAEVIGRHSATLLRGEQAPLVVAAGGLLQDAR